MGETLYVGLKCILMWCLRIVRVRPGETRLFLRAVPCSGLLVYRVDSLGRPLDAPYRAWGKFDRQRHRVKEVYAETSLYLASGGCHTTALEIVSCVTNSTACSIVHTKKRNSQLSPTAM